MQVRSWLVVGLLVAPVGLAAQVDATDPMAATRRAFGDVVGYVLQAAELVPADRYGYRPAESVRTFGQLVGHIADGQNWYCARAAGQPVEWSDPVEKGASDKATLVARLKESIERCQALHGASGRVGPLIHNASHTSLHYGNMITYLRTMGLVPPSS